MNISELDVALTGKDILSIINEFVKIEELNVESIVIDDSIIISGTFKRGITINFRCGVKLKSVENNMIEGEIESFKVINLAIPTFMRKVILKYALKSLSDKGINYENGKVYIQYKYILKDVPFIDFNIDKIFFQEDKISVSVRSIELSLEGALKKEVSLFVKEEKKIELEEEIRGKKSDYYTNGRAKVENKLPENFKKYSDYIFILPDLAVLLARLMKDNRVPMKTKLVISGAVAYIISPKDFIPDKIPFIGGIDELAVTFFAINRVIKDVPKYIILENWQGKNDIIVVIKNLIEYVNDFTGAKNIESMYNFLDDILTV